MGMNRLEVFFDYICPFCLQGHENLLSLLPDHPSLEVVWRPCESHPRPEHFGPHSDLCIRGMFYAADHDVPLENYHNRIYHAIHTEHIDIERPAELVRLLQDLLEPESFAAALATGCYAEELAAANRLAFERSGVWAVPAYRLNGKKLDSVEDVGVSLEQLCAFLDANIK